MVNHLNAMEKFLIKMYILPFGSDSVRLGYYNCESAFTFFITGIFAKTSMMRRVTKIWYLIYDYLAVCRRKKKTKRIGNKCNGRVEKAAVD